MIDDGLRLEVENLGRAAPGATNEYAAAMSIWRLFRSGGPSLPRPIAGTGGGGDDDDDDDDDLDPDEEIEGDAVSAMPRKGWSLRGASFELRAGEALALVGDEVSGADVLLHLLSGLFPPDAGRAVVHGRSTHAVFHAMGLLRPEMTVASQTRALALLYYIPRRLRRRWRAELVDVALHGLEREVDDIREASRRLALAAAIDPTADVLLIDAWPDAEDGIFRQRCEQRLARALERGAAAVVRLDSLATMTELCTRALLLDEGRIVDDGTPVSMRGRVHTGRARALRARSLPGFNSDAAILGVRVPRGDAHAVEVVVEVETSVTGVSLTPRLHLRAAGDDVDRIAEGPVFPCPEPGRFDLVCEVAPPSELELEADVLVDVTGPGGTATIGRRHVTTVAGAPIEAPQFDPDLEDARLDELLDSTWRIERQDEGAEHGP